MNHVTLIGSLAADCDLRYSAQGQPCCTFRLNVPREGGSHQVDCINVGIWGETAEQVCHDLTAGRRVRVAGRLRVWQQDGREVVGVVATGLRLLEHAPAAPTAG